MACTRTIRKFTDILSRLATVKAYTVIGQVRFVEYGKQSLLQYTSKCKVLTITRKKTPIIYEYTLGTEKLTRFDHEKDLGITTTTKLSWKLHINTIVAKVNKMLGVLKRTFTDMNTRRTLYLSLVKSQLLNASIRKCGRRLTTFNYRDK